MVGLRQLPSRAALDPPRPALPLPRKRDREPEIERKLENGLKYNSQGFFQLFAQGGGGRMRLYGLLGGQVRICVQSMGQTRGVRGHAPPEKFCSLTY